MRTLRLPQLKELKKSSAGLFQSARAKKKKVEAINKEWITCFCAVAEKQNFTAAAESLYIAESTASKRIVQLEKYLGVKLFERNKRSVRLTAAGQVFLSECQAYLHYGEELVRRVQEAAGKAKPLRVTVLGALAHHYAPLFQDFGQQHPEYPLDLHIATQRELFLQLQNGKADFVIGLEEELHKDKCIDTRPLHQEDEGILCPADVSFSEESSLHLSDLQEYPFVLLQEEEAPYNIEHFYRQCHQQGFHPHVVGTSANVMEIVFWVEIHKGISVLPKHMVDFVVTSARFLSLAESQPLVIAAAWKQLGENGQCLLDSLSRYDSSE